MSVEVLGEIFRVCFQIMEKKLTIFGYQVTLWQFLAFDLLLGLVLYWILTLFQKD